MDLGPTLMALQDKQFELDVERQTLQQVQQLAAEQLHRLQLEERLLLQQLEGTQSGAAFIREQLSTHAPAVKRPRLAASPQQWQRSSDSGACEQASRPPEPDTVTSQPTPEASAVEEDNESFLERMAGSGSPTMAAEADTSDDGDGSSSGGAVDSDEDVGDEEAARLREFLLQELSHRRATQAAGTTPGT